MKKIIFLSIFTALLLQGCKTAGNGEEKKPLEMDPKKLFSSSAKGMGNCSACHAIPAEPNIIAGNMGPPIVGMKDRFATIDKLKEAIADQRKFQPDTMMPPFGRNKILTPEQIDAIAQYLYKY